MKKLLLILSPLIIFISGCTTTVEEHSFPSNLMGVIFDNFNNPVGGANIELEGYRTLTSDIDGRFIIPQLNKGKYELKVTKDGYEINIIKIDYYDPKQVLYIKLSSFSYFKTEIEELIRAKNWNMAESMISRALKINSEDPVLLYLAAVYSYFTNDYSASSGYLKTLEDAGYKTDAVENLKNEIAKKNETENGTD